MDAEWIKSPTARLVLAHWADARPAWLWSQDGETLLWRNDAARYFHGKLKRHSVKLAPEAVPIRGTVARLVRLGSMGHPSLSRVQFLAGERPISTTCTCTPVDLGSGRIGMLIVAVDPIGHDVLEARDLTRVDALTMKLLPEAAEFLLVSEDGQITAGSPYAFEHFAPVVESEGLPEDGEIELAGEQVAVTRYDASPHDAILLLFERRQAAAATRDIATVRADEGEVAHEDDAPDQIEPAIDNEPLLPLGLPAAAHADDEPLVAEEDSWVEPIAQPAHVPGTLSSLFDRLADDEGLYAPLTATDEQFAGPPPEEAAELLQTIQLEQPSVAVEPDAVVVATEDTTPEPQAPSEPDVIAAVIDYADEDQASVAATTWRVIGRGFESLASDRAGEDEARSVPIPDAETVERVSRYNFDELSRILTDRVNGQAKPDEPLPQPANDGALINLAGETFILNRLPLGILVFRDQQVLFANRALTELTGYDSIESIRAAGLTAIFPSEDAGDSGPVTQLVRRDGSLAPVNARLQSITWQGRPALMLSASAAETRMGHEAAVRTFAELAAETTDDGFIAADRSGTVTSVSLHGRILLGMTEEEIVGRPLAAFIDPSQLREFKAFLERPARFAETTRPAILFNGANPNLRVTAFAEGQAGVVAGYFAFIRKSVPSTSPSVLPPASDDIESSMLNRISRSVRRPLNTVIGFADLLRASALGATDTQRHIEYAQDIKSAGQEIATLVDELDDYARLKDGRYPSDPGVIDLVELLEACLSRVRRQAGDARVLVRSAVSERLPRITADRASLTQGILNLLASAIDQTPPGGSVILSAQREDDGAVVVNVRDGGESRKDLGERFVVFRDGIGRDGEQLEPVRSSVGLALTRSLLAVNALSLSVDPVVGVGNMFSLFIPADLLRE